jgi:hypothetical protein
MAKRQYTIYTKGSYSFFNGVNGEGDSVLPAPIFRFKDEVVRRDVPLSDVITAIDSNGGYFSTTAAVARANGVTVKASIVDEESFKYSQGDICQSCDYYLMADYIAVVYRRDSNESRLFLTTGEVTYGTFDELMPDHYLATQINRALGMPTPKNEWCCLGDRFWQHLTLTAISGIDADFHIFEGYSEYAAFGVHSTRLAASYLPANKVAAEALFKLFTGKAVIKVNGKNRVVPIGFKSKDLGEDGFVLTADMKVGAQSLRTKLRKGLAVSDINWAQRTKNPGYSNDDNEFSAQIAFAVGARSQLQSDHSCEGVLYADHNGVENICADILRILSGESTTLDNGNLYIEDAAINKVLEAANVKRLEFISKAWQVAADTFHDYYDAIYVQVVDYAALVKNEVVESLKDDLMNKIRSAGYPVSPNASLNISDFDFDYSLVEPSIAYNSGGTPDQNKAYIRSVLNCYGLGAKIDEHGNPLLLHTLTDEQKAVVKSKFSVVIGGMFNAISQTIGEMRKQMDAVSFSCTQGVTTHYTRWFKNRTQDWSLVPSSEQTSKMNDKVVINNLSIVQINGGYNVKVTFDYQPVSMIIRWGDDGPIVNTIKTACNVMQNYGWNFKFIGRGEVVRAFDDTWWHFSNRCLWSYVYQLINGPSFGKDLIDWKEVNGYTLEFSKDVKYITPSIEVSFPATNTSEYIKALDANIEALGWIEYATYIADYASEVLEATATMAPFAYVTGLPVSIEMVKAFFKCTLLDDATYQLAISKMIEIQSTVKDQAAVDKIETAKNILIQLVNCLKTAAGTQMTIRWMDESKLVNCDKQFEPDIAPLAMFMLEDN